MDRIKYKDWESIIVLYEKFGTDRVRLNAKIRFKISNKKHLINEAVHFALTFLRIEKCFKSTDVGLKVVILFQVLPMAVLLYSSTFCWRCLGVYIADITRIAQGTFIAVHNAFLVNDWSFGSCILTSCWIFLLVKSS